jgi:thioredoxin reductase
MLDEIGKDIYFQHKEDILGALAPYAVEYFTSHKLLAVTDKGITVKDLDSMEEKEFELDGVVISLGRQPDNSLLNKLRNEIAVPVIEIGDARSVARIKDAVHSGYNSAYEFTI